MRRYWFSYDRTRKEAEALAVERYRAETGRLGRVTSVLDNATMGGGEHPMAGRARGQVVFVETYDMGRTR